MSVRHAITAALVAGLLLGVVAPAAAQAEDSDEKRIHFGVYVLGGVLNFGGKKFYCCAIVGAEFPLTIKGRPLGIVVEAAFHYTGRGDGTGGYMSSYLAGVKKRFASSRNVKTFGQVLAGVQNNFGTFVMVQPGGGLDIRFKEKYFLRFQGDMRMVANLVVIRVGFRAAFGVVIPIGGF